MATRPCASLPLLADGELLPVVAVAERVFGRPVTTNSVRRWCLNGRAGIRLPAVRGPRARHLTTERAFRSWLAETSGTEIPQAPAAPAKDHAADAILAGFGLGRDGRRGA